MVNQTDRQLAHEARQPLNVISLAVANLRLRISPRLDESDAAYLTEKLDRIEEQVAKTASILGR